MRFYFTVLAIGSILFLPNCLNRRPVSIQKSNSNYFLDSLFEANKNQSFSYDSTKGILRMGELFKANYYHAVFYYPVNDSQYDFKILLKNNRIWDTIFQQKVKTYFEGGVYKPDISFVNVLGDSTKELLVTVSRSLMHYCEQKKLFVYQANSLKEIKGFSEIPNPDFGKNGNIYSYISTGCADMSMWFAVYKIEADSIYCVDGVSVNCCREDGNCLINDTTIVKRSKAHLYVPYIYRDRLKSKLITE